MVSFRVDVSEIRAYEDKGPQAFYANRGRVVDEQTRTEFEVELERFRIPRSQQRPTHVYRIRAEEDYQAPFVALHDNSSQWETKPREILAVSTETPNSYDVIPVFLHRNITEGSKLEVAAAWDILSRNESRIHKEFKRAIADPFKTTVPFQSTIYGYGGIEVNFLRTDKYNGRFASDFGEISYLSAAKRIAGKIRRRT